MKKVFSILFALIILLSGMHLTVDSHYCGGKLAAVKISTTGEKATCGMEDEADLSLPMGDSFKSICCNDDLTTLTTDSNYSPSHSQGIDFIKKVTAVYAIPLSEAIPEVGISKNSHPILSPRDVFRKTSVSLASICVFRI